MNNINPSRLFLASCMALVTTSMTFGIRAGMLGDLGAQFHLTNSEVGVMTGMAFFAFPIATTLGGFFVDLVGMKRWMLIAFVAHLLAICLTIFAEGYLTLVLSTFFIGFANGLVEAVCNPLVASMYPNNKVVMLNRFHVWFPGGIVIGALAAAGLKEIGFGWQFQVALILIPTLIYGYLFLGQTFPKTERVDSGVSFASMMKACTKPLFIFLAFCMFFTAVTELSTGQYVGPLFKGAGVNALLMLALINGLMAFGRFFGEPVMHRLNPIGVLLGSAIIATLGVFLLRTCEGNMLYAAAAVFAAGVCYFWPTMLGVVSEKIPQSGALGMSLVGGVGMLGNWAFQTFFIGPKLDADKLANVDELTSGHNVLSTMNMLPIVLILAFGALYFYLKNNTSETSKS